LLIETFTPTGTLGRETSYDVVLERRFLTALGMLNPDLPEEALKSAVEELMKERGLMSFSLD
jgi:type I restriction enzyme R subunit